MNECIDVHPILKSSTEPISSLLSHLTNKTFYKAAKKSLEENNVETVADLCNMTPAQINTLKGLKPPNNMATVKESLRKFEKLLQKREIITIANNALYNKSSPENKLIPKEAFEDKKTSKLSTAPFMESSTPDEEDKALKEIYERPSPSPTELEQDAATAELFNENVTKDVVDDESRIDDNSSASLIAMKSKQKSETKETEHMFSTAQNNLPNQDNVERSIEHMDEVPNANYSKNEGSIHQPEIFDVETQTIQSNASLVDVETSTDVITRATVSTSEVQAVVNTVAGSCQAIAETLEAEIQTTELTEEIKLQETYNFLQTLDVKTLSSVIGKLHGFLNEKISKL